MVPSQGWTCPTAWTCPPLPRGIHCSTNVTNDPNFTAPCPRTPPPLLPLHPLRPLNHPWSRHGSACGIHVLPVQRGKCCSLPHPPCWRTGPWCQRCRRGHCNASVSSLPANSRPSFASWAAAASRATAMAARRRWHSSMTPLER